MDRFVSSTYLEAVPRALTAKQSSFVSHYVECGVGAEAVRRAGYQTKRPENIANELLGIDRVQDAIEKLRAAAAAAARITPEIIMQGLAKEARDPKNTGSTRVAAWKALQDMVPGAKVPSGASVSVNVGAGGGVTIQVPHNERDAVDPKTGTLELVESKVVDEGAA